jgi:hypothetical protein
MTNMRVATCGDCIHAEICKQVNSGWFSPKNIAYCKAFKDHTKYAEVVRCRDCKHWHDGFCDNPHGMDIGATPDAFCSHGENKNKDLSL